MRKRLYLQIYLALVGALAMFALATCAVWWMVPRDHDAELFLDGMAELVGDALPSADRPASEQQAALARLSAKFNADLTLLDAHGSAVASVGPVLDAPSLPGGHSGITHTMNHGMLAVLALEGGRRLVADHSRHHHYRPFGALLLLAALAATLALASLPVARRLTRRLERLKTGVDELGLGDLRARVAVEGRDEVAELARSFNRAAKRIERLVHAQKDALATASHELRSPLARMRVAIELLGPDTRADVRERIALDIDELDELIGEILLTSRLDASVDIERCEDVDLLALVAEEGARVGADVGGDATTGRSDAATRRADGTTERADGATERAVGAMLRGDARLLRRLTRNLFENARRYGADSPIEAEVSRLPDGSIVLRVSDRGPGIPASERERVFEAFYRRAGTSEGEGGGVGLGLALVKRIAESHGGSARALERSGGGTTIEVMFAKV